MKLGQTTKKKKKDPFDDTRSPGGALDPLHASTAGGGLASTLTLASSTSGTTTTTATMTPLMPLMPLTPLTPITSSSNENNNSITSNADNALVRAEQGKQPTQTAVAAKQREQILGWLQWAKENMGRLEGKPGLKKANFEEHFEALLNGAQDGTLGTLSKEQEDFLKKIVLQQRRIEKENAEREAARAELMRWQDLLNWASSNSDPVRKGRDGYFEYEQSYLVKALEKALRAADPIAALKDLKDDKATWDALQDLARIRDEHEGKNRREDEERRRKEEQQRKTEEGKKKKEEQDRQEAERKRQEAEKIKREYETHLKTIITYGQTNGLQGRAVCIAQCTNMPRAEGLSGADGQLNNFYRTKEGSVRYKHEESRNDLIKTLEERLSHPSYEDNRETWACAEVDCAVQLALNNRDWRQYLYLTAIKEPTVESWHFLQTCNNCSLVFKERPRPPN